MWMTSVYWTASRSVCLYVVFKCTCFANRGTTQHRKKEARLTVSAASSPRVSCRRGKDMHESCVPGGRRKGDWGQNVQAARDGHVRDTCRDATVIPTPVPAVAGPISVVQYNHRFGRASTGSRHPVARRVATLAALHQMPCRLQAAHWHLLKWLQVKWFKALFSLRNFLSLATVALSFVFKKYCPIMD
jgi:hypothetical protein